MATFKIHNSTIQVWLWQVRRLRVRVFFGIIVFNVEAVKYYISLKRLWQIYPGLDVT